MSRIYSVFWLALVLLVVMSVWDYTFGQYSYGRSSFIAGIAVGMMFVLMTNQVRGDKNVIQKEKGEKTVEQN